MYKCTNLKVASLQWKMAWIYILAMNIGKSDLVISRLTLVSHKAKEETAVHNE